MFHNVLGQQIENEQPIFPLISFEKKYSRFKCLGTAFFINPTGWFVTAKHVLYDNNQNIPNMILGVQTQSNNNQVIREVTHLSLHPSADIAIGRLGTARNGSAEIVQFELAPTFKLSFKKLEANDHIMTFGYPRTSKEVNDNLTTFSFMGIWTRGKVEDFCPNGSPVVRNRCYQTSMLIDTGASGGPVFKDNVVIGINSSGYELGIGEVPLSFISPIDLILDLELEIDNEQLPIRDLINLRHINAEY